MKSLHRPLVINFFSSSGTTIVNFIASVILARLLSPGEIGVYSITIVFVNIAHIFRDFGVGIYLQREPDLTAEKVGAAIAMVFTTSWIIAALLYFSSSWIGLWFAEPMMVPVMKVLAIGFVFIPFGTVTTSLLAREFAAEKQALVSIVGTATFAITCLSLAALGFGTMSMAWANLVNIVVSAMVLYPMRSKNFPWRPSLKHWRDVFHFGVGSLLSNTLVSINNAVADILLGKLGNATLVGLFSRASATVGIFWYLAGSTMNYGSISYISQTHHRGEPLGPLLNRATALVTGVAWPAFALTSLFSHEIIATLYGDKWLAAVPAINALAISAAIGIIFNYTPIALTAIGRPYLSAIPTLVTVLTRIGFGYLLFDGTIESFAWAICAATAFATPFLVLQHRLCLQHRFYSMLQALVPSSLVALICTIGAIALKALLPASIAPILMLSILLLPIAGLWYLALRLTSHPLTAELHKIGAGLRARLP